MQVDDSKSCRTTFGRRLQQIGTTTVGVPMTIEYGKKVIFNGEREYPVETLKELTELQGGHPEHDINWLGRHTEGEAAIWWRLIKNDLKNFQEFSDAFIDKYWDALIQEEVRDRLEFGRFR